MSGALNTVAVSLMKIANDVRLLGSGPRWVISKEGKVGGGKVYACCTNGTSASATTSGTRAQYKHTQHSPTHI